MNIINYNNTDFIIQKHSFNNKYYFSISISDIKLLMYFSFEEEQVSQTNLLNHIQQNIQHYSKLFSQFSHKSTILKNFFLQRQFSNIDSSLLDFVFKHGFYCSLLSKYLELYYHKDLFVIFSKSSYTFPYFFIFLFSNNNCFNQILKKNEDHYFFQQIYYHFKNYFVFSNSISYEYLNKKYIESLSELVPEHNKPIYNFLCLIHKDNMTIDDIFVESFKKHKKFDTGHLYIFTYYTQPSIYDKLFKYVPLKELQQVFIKYPFNIINASLSDFLKYHLKLQLSNYISKQNNKLELTATVFHNLIHSLEDHTYSYSDIEDNFIDLFSSLNFEEYLKFKKEHYEGCSYSNPAIDFIFESLDLRYQAINF